MDIISPDDLLVEVQTAFLDVELEDGIGLWEAHGLDDHEPSEVLKKLREKDERSDWRKIPADDLTCCTSSLSFVDPKGMRFILPAFVTSAIKNRDLFIQDKLIASLTIIGTDYSKEKFLLFSKTQGACVIRYLNWHCQQPGQSNWKLDVDNAITEYREIFKL